MRDVRTTSDEHMTHSYWPLSMSSWIRVVRSGASDLDALLRHGFGASWGLDLGGRLSLVGTGCPGTKAGASALRADVAS